MPSRSKDILIQSFLNQTFLAMANYWMLALDFSSDFDISLVGSGINCPSSSIDSLASINTSQAELPSTITKTQYQQIAYAREASTLVACVGSQVSNMWFKTLNRTEMLSYKIHWSSKISSTRVRMLVLQLIKHTQVKQLLRQIWQNGFLSDALDTYHWKYPTLKSSSMYVLTPYTSKTSFARYIW